MKQLALFQDDEFEVMPKNGRVSAIPDEIISAYDFDFTRDGDRACLIPRPYWKPPTWLTLGIDDPDWMPDLGVRIG